jgi:hypothetical protein
MQGAASHRLLISDANILIDISAGKLLNVMFRLDHDFVLPDVLYVEELQEQYPELPGMPAPEVIAQEIVEDLEAALEQFREIAGDLNITVATE